MTQKAEVVVALGLLSIFSAMAFLTAEQEIWLKIVFGLIFLVSVALNLGFWWFVVKSIAELIADILADLLERFKLWYRRLVMLGWLALGVWQIWKSVVLMGSTTQLWWVAAIEGFVLLGLLLMVVTRLRKI